jgi:host factor-I protein
MANEKPQSVQDVFLNNLRKTKMPVTIFLVNGVKLQGIITWFDNFSVLRRDAHSAGLQHATTIILGGAPRCSSLARKARKLEIARRIGHYSGDPSHEQGHRRASDTGLRH